MTIGKLTKIKRVVLFSTILIFSLMSYYQAPITIQCLEQYLTPAHENDAVFLILQESVYHVVLEADRYEPFFIMS